MLGLKLIDVSKRGPWQGSVLEILSERHRAPEFCYNIVYFSIRWHNHQWYVYNSSIYCIPINISKYGKSLLYYDWVIQVIIVIPNFTTAIKFKDSPLSSNSMSDLIFLKANTEAIDPNSCDKIRQLDWHSVLEEDTNQKLLSFISHPQYIPYVHSFVVFWLILVIS